MHFTISHAGEIVDSVSLAAVLAITPLLLVLLKDITETDCFEIGSRPDKDNLIHASFVNNI